MGSTGGTKIYCPNCKAVQTCRVCHDLDSWTKGNYRNQTYPDINFFERPRECLKCGDVFVTYEVYSDLILELVNLRNFVKEMKLAFDNPQNYFKADS